MVRNDPTAFAATEVMQAAEILFATLIGVLWLGEAWPQGRALEWPHSSVRHWLQKGH